MPHFLGAQDHPWLRALIDEHERFVGRRQHELERRLREPMPFECPRDKLALATGVLARLRQARRRSLVEPRQARAAVFRAAAGGAAARDERLADVAVEFGVSAGQLEESLFADLPGERIVLALDPRPSPSDLALRANLAFAQGLLHRSRKVTLEVEGNARAVVRQAKLRRLLCAVARGAEGDATLQISGPFALFRHTLVYGRALGEFLPVLAWCNRFRLEASCRVADRQLTLRLATGNPIFPSAEPRAYDSQLEERFARDFRRLAPDWDVIREPEPVRAGPTLVIPDFALQHRHQPERRWLVELVGFWTPGYLARKLADYRRAELKNLILCIDEERDCQPGDLPADARIVWYRRRVNAGQVLAQVG